MPSSNRPVRCLSGLASARPAPGDASLVPGDHWLSTDTGELVALGEDGLGNRAWNLVGSESLRVDPDTSDLLVYLLDESASPCANTGPGGVAAPLVLTGGALGAAGPFDSTCLWADSCSGLGTTANRPVNAITLSLWLKTWKVDPRTGGYPYIFGKSANPGAWAAPWASCGIMWGNFSDGRFRSAITANDGTADGAVVEVGSLDLAYITLGAWHHVGFTYEQATGMLREYLDGELVGSTAGVGGRALYWKNDGEWFLGTVPWDGGTSTQRIADVRVANVARPASWFSEVYRRAMGTYR